MDVTIRQVGWALAASLAMSGAGHASELRIDSGVVVKFGDDAGLVVRDRLITGDAVTLTSIRDSSAGGDTSMGGGDAQPGDWRGVRVESSTPLSGLSLQGVEIRYAGASEAAALDVRERPYVLRNFVIRDSIRGLRIMDEAHVQVIGARIAGNTVGVEVGEASEPTLTNSEFVGNHDFAILNFDPEHVVMARGNWWGAPTGPFDPDTSPDGDAVSAGVDTGEFLTEEPLNNCTVVSASGSYTVQTPQIPLAIGCPGAATMRFSESSDFAGATWIPYQPAYTFALTPVPGARPVYAEFSTLAGRVVDVELAEEVVFDAGIPEVEITLPTDGAEVSTTTTLRARITHPMGIASVRFLMHDTEVAVVNQPSQAIVSAQLDISTLSDGAYPMRVVATDEFGVVGEARVLLAINRVGEDGRYFGPPYFHTSYDDNGPHPDVATALASFWDSYQRYWNRPQCTFQVNPLDPHVNDGRVASLPLGNGCSGGGSLRATEYGTTISISRPADGAVLTTDTLVEAVVDAQAPIQFVEFLVGSTVIGQDASRPYRATLRVADFAQGDVTLSAVAHGSSGPVASDAISVTVVPPEPDVTPPQISGLSLGGQPLVDAMTVNEPGVLSFQVTDESGVAGVSAVLNGEAVDLARSGTRYTAFLDLEALPDGTYLLQIAATDTVGNAAALDFNLNVQIQPPQVPAIENPRNGQVVDRADVLVSGSAMPGSLVSFTLNGAAAGEVPAGPEGNFSLRIDLAGEGQQRLVPEASNSRGSSGPGEEIVFTYEAAGPTVVILQPVANATLEDDVRFVVSASDPAGVQEVEFLIDGERIALVPHEPGEAFEAMWSIDGQDNGTYEFTARAVSALNKETSVSRSFTIDRYVEPPPVWTPYTGRVSSVSPATSLGSEPIQINGMAVDRELETPVANALLALVLEVGQFQRRINVTTNETGHFAFTFQPQASDAGTYRVGARHPDEPTAQMGGSFTINRLQVSPQRVNLRAAHGVPTVVPVEFRASAGTGARGVRVEVDPDYPLPSGVSITPSDRVDVPAGSRVVAQVGFTGSAAATAVGTVHLVARSLDTGNQVRGRVQVDYQLSAPQPLLRIRPTHIDTGVRRGDQVTESVTLENAGVAGAHGLQVSLVEADAPLPSWLRVSSSSQIGTLGVGETTRIEVTASPPESSSDGVYRARLQVQGDNWAPSSIPVVVSVTNSQTGSVEFHVSNIYTQTLDENGDPIPGLAGARVRIEHELVPTQVFTATTDASGRARIDDVPAGRYIYRVSASNHVDESGRVLIRAGATVEEEAFLDYAAVSFEWSVVETTIEDRYDVVLEATFQAQVPAPVVLMRPLSINLPDMQAGEEITGELTITNYGLVRAENVALNLPGSDEYFDFEFMGEIPGSLEARQQVSLPYRVIAKAPLPAMNPPVFEARNVVTWAIQSVAQASVGCWHYRRSPSLRYDYECANGERRGGSASSSFNKAYGSGCSSGGTPVRIGGGGGGGGGGWGGGFGGGPGAPMGPQCIPECEDGACPKPGGASGGGQ